MIMTNESTWIREEAVTAYTSESWNLLGGTELKKNNLLRSEVSKATQIKECGPVASILRA